MSAPEGFGETTLTIDETQYRAWVSSDAQGEVYLLYARNPKGETGFYTYSVEDSSMQRYAVMPARPVMDTSAPAETAAPAATAEPETPAAGGTSNTLLYIMIAVAVLLAAALVYVIVHHNREEQKRRERIARRRAERENAMKAE